jgi:hypothetical protein
MKPKTLKRILEFGLRYRITPKKYGTGMTLKTMAGLDGGSYQGLEGGKVVE